MSTYDKLYHSASGVIAVFEYENESDFTQVVNDFEENSDFEFFGYYDSIESINDELLYQGLTMEEITKYNLNHYGHCIEVVENSNNEFLLFIGNR